MNSICIGRPSMIICGGGPLVLLKALNVRLVGLRVPPDLTPAHREAHNPPMPPDGLAVGAIYGSSRRGSLRVGGSSFSPLVGFAVAEKVPQQDVTVDHVLDLQMSLHLLDLKPVVKAAV